MLIYGWKDSETLREEAAFLLTGWPDAGIELCVDGPTPWEHLEILCLGNLTPLFYFSPLPFLSARIADRFHQAWPLWIIYTWLQDTAHSWGTDSLSLSLLEGSVQDAFPRALLLLCACSTGRNDDLGKARLHRAAWSLLVRELQQLPLAPWSVGDLAPTKTADGSEHSPPTPEARSESPRKVLGVWF